MGIAEATRSAVTLTDLRFSWQRRGGFSMAVDAFTVLQGERILLTAQSGAGKSTLISLIAGIARPQSGIISMAGTDIVRLRQSRRDAFRAEHIGLIFQSFNLVPYLSAIENILLPLSFAPQRLQRAGGWRSARISAGQMLDEIGLAVDQFGGRKAAQLSVGQQQRVAVLRALIGAPELIIADEPTSALDSDRQKAFLDMLFRQLDQTRSALIMVSHDRGLAKNFDRSIQLESFARTEQGQ